jgi:ribosomal-protein-alanine N-acetyltransferase
MRQTPTPTIVLETARLVLRCFQPGDLEALYALYRDPQMRRFFPEGTLTRAQTQEEIDGFREGHPDDARLGLWAAETRDEGAFVGRCGLLPWVIEGRQEIELAYLIDRRRWGEGLATEAAQGILRYAREQLGLQRVICLIMHGNTASVRVAEKLGMRYERDMLGDFGACMVYGRRLP